jgi:ATP-dependent Clp protease ATP-binding subunit ClpC
VFERYTEPARRTIFFARWWALNRKASLIEPSDIILGAAQQARRESSQLRWMKLDYERIVTLFAEGVVVVEKPDAKDLPLSDESKMALAYAAEEAEIDRRYSLEVYHLVRGVLRTNGHTAKALSSAGINLDVLRDGSGEANRNLPDAQLRLRLKTQLQLLHWRIFSKYKWLTAGFAFLGFVAAIFYLRSQN